MLNVSGERDNWHGHANISQSVRRAAGRSACALQVLDVKNGTVSSPSRLVMLEAARKAR